MADDPKKRKSTPHAYWWYLALLVGSLTLFTHYAVFSEEKLVSFDLKKMSVAKYAVQDTIVQDTLTQIDTLAVAVQEDTIQSPTDFSARP